MRAVIEHPRKRDPPDPGRLGNLHEGKAAPLPEDRSEARERLRDDVARLERFYEAHGERFVPSRATALSLEWERLESPAELAPLVDWVGRLKVRVIAEERAK